MTVRAEQRDGERDLVTSLSYLSGWFNAAVEARQPRTSDRPRHFVPQPVVHEQRPD